MFILIYISWGVVFSGCQLDLGDHHWPKGNSGSLTLKPTHSESPAYLALGPNEPNTYPTLA